MNALLKLKIRGIRRETVFSRITFNPSGEGLLHKQVISVRTAFRDIHWVIEEMVGEGDKVLSRFTWYGTSGGEFFDVPATGKQITVKGMVVDRVTAGKMAESQ